MKGLLLPREYHRRILLAPLDPNILTLPYLKKVLDIGGRQLISLWSQGEQSGTVAYDLSGRGHNGAYTGVTFTVPNAELLANIGFETGGPDFGAWVETAGDGTIAVEGTLVHGGSQAIKLTAGATPAFTPQATNTAVGVPWTQYTFSAWSRGDGTNAGRYKVYDATASADIVALTSTGIAGTSYAQFSQAFTAPGGCVAVRPQIYGPNLNGGIAYFDDASLVAAAPNGPPGMNITAPYYDSLNDFNNIYSAALAAAFNGNAGTIVSWVRVGASSVYADGAYREIIRLLVDGGNHVILRKTDVANTLHFQYAAGGTTLVIPYVTASTNWVCYVITWDKEANKVCLYADGILVGSDSGLGNWVGSIASGNCAIGAAGGAAAEVWSGLSSVTAYINVAKSPAEIYALSKVT